MEKTNTIVGFSVLMANHNRGEYLAESIESVQNQNFQNWELLILDDASTDISLEIIEKYMNQDARIKLKTHTQNKGVGATKKELIDWAQGEICGFLDSDDTLEPNALEGMYQWHQVHPETIIYSQHTITDEQLNFLRKGSSRRIPKGETHLSYFGISHFATFKRKDYLQTQGLNPELTKAIDQDLYYQLEEINGSAFVPESLYNYRHNTQSISLNEGEKKATQNKHKLQNKAIERRKKNGQKVPSEALMQFQQAKDLDETKSQSISHLLNYYLYQLKNKLKLWLLK